MEPELSNDPPGQILGILWGARMIVSLALGIAYGAAFQNLGGGLVIGLGVGIMSRRSIFPVFGLLLVSGLFWITLSL